MPRTLKTFVISAVTLIIGLVAGAALGQRQGWGMGKTFMRQELEGMLNLHVETASAIRIGDTDRALALLDSLIDSAIVTMHSQPEAERSMKALSEAKVYRRAVPSTGPMAAGVVEALANAPEPDKPTARLAKLVAQSAK